MHCSKRRTRVAWRITRCQHMIFKTSEFVSAAAGQSVRSAQSAHDTRYKVHFQRVSLKPGLAPSENIRKLVEASVIREIGPIARPRRVVIVPDMPKTRSGKIMRRVLAAISNNEDAGDISPLANPENVNEIRKTKS
jgi:AMP-binding enzyme C-terminal domain